MKFDVPLNKEIKPNQISKFDSNWCDISFTPPKNPKSVLPKSQFNLISHKINYAKIPKPFRSALVELWFENHSKNQQLACSNLTGATYPSLNPDQPKKKDKKQT